MEIDSPLKYFRSLKAESNGVIDENDFYYDDHTSAICTGLLNFCECGNPDLALEFVGDSLRLL